MQGDKIVGKVQIHVQNFADAIHTLIQRVPVQIHLVGSLNGVEIILAEVQERVEKVCVVLPVVVLLSR